MIWWVGRQEFLHGFMTEGDLNHPEASGERAADWAARKATVFYYALFAWRARPQSAPGYRAFGLAQASGYGMLSILLMIAVIAEGVPMHLLLRSWSARGGPARLWRHSSDCG